MKKGYKVTVPLFSTLFTAVFSAYGGLMAVQPDRSLELPIATQIFNRFYIMNRSEQTYFDTHRIIPSVLSKFQKMD